MPGSSTGRPSQPTPLRSTGISRSIETTSTPRSTRSTPRGRTRQTTGTAPRRHQRRRRRDSHAACSRTERDANPRTSSSLSRSRIPGPSARSPASRCPPVLATVSSAAVANPRVQELQALAGPRPRSEHLPGIRPASASQCRAYRPNPSESTSRTPAAEIAPALATASSTAPALAVPATAAFDSRRYCCRRA